VDGKLKKAVNETFWDGFGKLPSLQRQFPDFGIYLTYRRDLSLLTKSLNPSKIINGNKSSFSPDSIYY
jgi:hypothetical protein